MIYIVGGRGLVGSGLVRYAEHKALEFRVIQRENKHEFLGTSCDVLVYAAGNPFKYKAAEDPYFDFQESLSSVAEYVHGLDHCVFAHISSVDVYSDTSSYETTAESAVIDVNRLSPYGYHKYLAEGYVRRFCSSHLIFRLPGLVGPGLKKNPAYDFMHSEKQVMISAESRLNFIHTDIVAESIFSIIDKSLTGETFNLGSRDEIRIGDIKDVVGFDSDYTVEAGNYLQTYRFNCDKIQDFCKLPTSEESLAAYATDIGIPCIRESSRGAE
ncbi:NAD-dependent epimerase/dehydratase family protein [Candidatus Hydrogenedentota bacterium]